MQTNDEPGLRRRLGVAGSVAIGLAAMIGSGVFVVFAPAAAAAGDGLLLGLGLAALIAFCNATSTAALAARSPHAGGAYVFGRERLGDWWGYAAGWSFLVGKTASCAAMALVFAAYVAPAGTERLIAALAAAVVAGVSIAGITRTRAVASVLVAMVLGILLVVILSPFAAGPPLLPPVDIGDAGLYGVLQSAGLLFFAFAGYARIATLGEEVRRPAQTIPTAIVISFAVALTVYALVAVAALSTLGAARLAGSTAPLADVVSRNGWSWAVPLVTVGAAIATLGALLALIPGIGRTSLAMARTGDLPHGLARIDGRFGTPARAEALVAALVIVVVLVADVRGVIGFSSFGVLLYYLVANLSALRMTPGERLYPRAFALVGAAGCVVLVATLPLASVLAGAAVLAIGLVIRLLTISGRRRRAH
ncbi:APC family permease [Agromyces atrinae]|uniref:APC family permease n=1 Tax=Agromyces atrinae TaxID=592376 RepID=UPI001F58A527|nr:APC family permease [Agromyces atrinae]MCI2957924.1 APC family permease [Agromyces atrinae]